jgi:hypothetical protein
VFDIDVSEDIIEDEYWNEMEMEPDIEKRYMSVSQIRNKFIAQSNTIAKLGKRLEQFEVGRSSSDITDTQNRIDAAKSDIDDLFVNKDSISVTLEKSCGYLDDLMEDESPVVDCCINEFTVYCLTRTAMQAWDANFDITRGVCSACPDGLESSR